MTTIASRPYSEAIAQRLKSEGIHPVLARIFAARGIQSSAELNTELSALLPPSGLKGIQEAAVFLADCIAAGKRMTVIADYDCDGATACAVAIRGLRMFGAHMTYIVPNRFEYGYGLTPEIVELAIQTHAPDVLITVDNGIASVDGVKTARDRGLSVLITDHHLPGDTLPDANVIVNPNQPDCGFDSKSLAGVGVMFYVLLALRAELRQRGMFDQRSQPRLDTLLDLVALGTVADVVSLDSNNRVLVSQGLKRIRQGQFCPGVAALFRVAGRDFPQATPFDMGFALGPRLNAAGRLADMSLGIECLLTDSMERAWEIAQMLNSMNAERKQIEQDMQEVALIQLELYGSDAQHAIVAFDENWHQGVIGILASRLKDKFYRPVIAFAPGDAGLLKGSGRSIPGFHMRDALDLVSKRYPDLISKFGGHAMAAGLTIAQDDLPRFAKAFETVAQEWLQKEDLQKVVATDGALSADAFSLDFVYLLDQYVWGQSFPPPTFSGKFRVIQQRILKERHLKLVLEREDGTRYDGIWFGHNTYVPDVAHVAFRLDINEYNGTTRLQLLVEHIEE